jgi:putative SOS response-associated peptidase YedK
MCSRYSLTSPPEAVRSYFDTVNEPVFPPRYNIAPTQPVTIVRLDPKGQRELALVRWGLIPSWVKDPRGFATLINARSEGAADKPAFRGAMRHRRCLVPADGFYEWTGARGRKRPHLVRPRAAGPFAMAAIWEHWMGGDGSELETMAILTVPANRALAALHDLAAAELVRGLARLPVGKRGRSGAAAGASAGRPPRDHRGEPAAQRSAPRGPRAAGAGERHPSLRRHAPARRDPSESS